MTFPVQLNSSISTAILVRINFCDKGFRIGAIAFTLMAILLPAILLPACANNQPEVTAPETTERRADQGPITQDEQNVTINEVNNNLEELIGQTVTVRSEAEVTEEPNSFLLTMALAPEPGELTENPQAFYQQPIAVEGTVAEIRAPGIFTMHDEELFGGEDLLVLNVLPEKPVQEGETVPHLPPII